MIKTLLTLRNLAIVGGVMFTAFLVQTKRIGWLKDDVIELKAEKAQLQLNLRDAKEANDFALETISQLKEANEQCLIQFTSSKKMNEAEIQKLDEDIVQIKNKLNIAKNEISKIDKNDCSNQPIGNIAELFKHESNN